MRRTEAAAYLAARPWVFGSRWFPMLGLGVLLPRGSSLSSIASSSSSKTSAGLLRSASVVHGSDGEERSGAQPAGVGGAAGQVP